MNHYIYKITDTETGQYYIGMRSCNCEIENDPYMGSGKWIQDFRKEYGRFLQKGKHRFKKEILEECGSRSEAFWREEVCVGDLWKTDPLCMNMCVGGEGTGVGEDNPNYDPTIHHLWNHYENKEVFYTTYELRQMGVDFSQLKSGKPIHLKGISLYENKDKEIQIKLSDEKHHLWDHNENNEVFYTTNELYKMGIIISVLKSGKYIHEKGISLYENKDNEINIRMSDEKHHLWNHYENTEVFYTTNELYKMGVQYSYLKSGKYIHMQGISLYENKDKTVKLRKQA